MRELLVVENPLLRQKSKPIKEIDGLVREVAEFMEQQMGQKFYGLEASGFAAPQFGELLRIIIVKRDALTKMVILNPEIISEKGSRVKMEQCFSIPGHVFIVRRPKMVKCRGLNLNGEVVTLKGRDELARLLKHEVDHLDGILIDAIAQRRLY